MTDPPRKQPQGGRPPKYEAVYHAAGRLVATIRDSRHVDTFGFDMELARLIKALKEAERGQR